MAKASPPIPVPPDWPALVRGLLKLIDTVRGDSEGRYPAPDPGCIECTSGTVPDDSNTGRCAEHAARIASASLPEERRQEHCKMAMWWGDGMPAGLCGELAYGPSDRCFGQSGCPKHGGPQPPAPIDSASPPPDGRQQQEGPKDTQAPEGRNAAGALDGALHCTVCEDSWESGKPGVCEDCGVKALLPPDGESDWSPCLACWLASHNKTCGKTPGAPAVPTPSQEGPQGAATRGAPGPRGTLAELVTAWAEEIQHEAEQVANAACPRHGDPDGAGNCECPRASLLAIADDMRRIASAQPRAAAPDPLRQAPPPVSAEERRLQRERVMDQSRIRSLEYLLAEERRRNLPADVTTAEAAKADIETDEALRSAESAAYTRGLERAAQFIERMANGSAFMEWATGIRALAGTGAQPPSETPQECQRCHRVGGKSVSFTYGGFSTGRWICPHCTDAIETALRNLTTVLVDAMERRSLNMLTLEPNLTSALAVLEGKPATLAKTRAEFQDAAGPHECGGPACQAVCVPFATSEEHGPECSCRAVPAAGTPATKREE